MDLTGVFFLSCANFFSFTQTFSMGFKSGLFAETIVIVLIFKVNFRRKSVTIIFYSDGSWHYRFIKRNISNLQIFLQFSIIMELKNFPRLIIL